MTKLISLTNIIKVIMKVMVMHFNEHNFGHDDDDEYDRKEGDDDDGVMMIYVVMMMMASLVTTEMIMMVIVTMMIAGAGEIPFAEHAGYERCADPLHPHLLHGPGVHH
jgi:hypothetical protein